MTSKRRTPKPAAGTPRTSAPELIRKKRDGKALTDAEVGWFVDAFMRGEVADYQVTAFAMAVFFQGMSPRETAALTLAMRDSGTVVEWKNVTKPKVDKHSTGGVGDKVSICLAPIVAACGVPVPMVSGRGLGHTGGTLDKLEAIPGFSVHLPVAAFKEQVKSLGCSLIGQTSEIAPADKRIYALRDVSATVESIPLITASILSKKLAEGIDGLVLDVKVGRGAFMKSRSDARKLARSIVRVSALAGTRVTAVPTAMDAPLGRAIGNALETAEAFEVLHGGGPDDLVECTMVLGAEMLRLGGVARSTKIARSMMVDVIKSGKAAQRMKRIVEAQGGNPHTVDDPSLLPKAPVVQRVSATETGFVAAADAMALGLAAGALGAGRARADDHVDPSVGLVMLKKPGDRVEKGEALIEVHARDRQSVDAIAAQLRTAFEIRKKAPAKSPLVLETITA